MNQKNDNKTDEFEKQLGKLDFSLQKVLGVQDENAFLLLDFTTVAHYTKTKLRVVSRHNQCLPNYDTSLSKFFEESGYSFPQEKVDGLPYYLKNFELESSTQDTPSNKVYNVYPNEKNGDKLEAVEANLAEVGKEMTNWHTFVYDTFRKYVNSCFTYFLKFKTNSSNVDEYIEVGFYILCKYNISDEIAKNIAAKVKPFIYEHGIPFILEEIDRKNKYLISEIKKEAIKSAKGAIMGRNMSHNIGSHVIYYLRQQLSGDIMGMNELLHNLNFEEVETGKIKVSVNGTDRNKAENYLTIPKNDLDLPFLKGLGTFLTYLQERQDFIAALSSDYHPAYSSANFKSFVIDNFLRDLRAKRHTKANSRQEVNILTNYIVKSENTNLSFTLNGQELGTNEAIGTEDEVHTFSIDLPGSTLGRQAFYSVLENVIRNAAKHGKRKDDSADLKYDIRIEDDYEHTEEQRKLFKDKDAIDTWKQKYFQVRIKDNNHNPESLAKTLRESLQKELIDEQFKLEENEKGVKEIVISILWLNGLNITDISNKERIKYVDVKVSDIVDGYGSLEYVFYITKSKKILFVVDDESGIQHKGLKECGVVDYTTFKENIEECSRYNLVVDVHDSIDEIYHNKLRRYLRCEQGEMPSYLAEYGYKYKKSVVDTIKSSTDNNLYLMFYHWYIKKSFYADEEFPKLAFNIANQDDSSGGVHIETKHYTNQYEKSSGHSEEGSVLKIPASDIYVTKQEKDKESPQKQIAYRRHILDDLHVLLKGKDTKIYTSNNKTNVDTYLGKNGFITNALKDYKMIESVTGDNSSFRILNNEVKDDRWTLKKIEAAGARVLIIDERIYDNSVFYTKGGISEEGQKQAKDLLKQFFVDPENEKLKAFKFQGNVDLKQINILVRNCLKGESELGRKSDLIEIKGHDQKVYEFKEYKKFAKFILDLLHKNKGEEVFNIETVALNRLKNVTIANINPKYSYIVSDFEEKIGCIDFVDGGFKVENSSNNNYNFISIHQGILDKLYKKAKGSDAFTKEEKLKYTEKIIKALKKQFGEAIKVVIHTGRGRPNYVRGIAPYRSLSDLDYALGEPKELLLSYFESASFEI